MNDTREATVEVVTAGLLVIVFAFFLLGNVQEPLAMLLAGVILLGSAIYQTTRGWHVGLLTWILGGVFFLGGIGVRLFLVSFVEINWIAIALLFVGAYIVLNGLRGRG